MIQLNLLPDVKLEYIKAQKMRGLVTTASIIVAGVAVAILVLLLLFGLAQKKEISDHKSTVAMYTSRLEGKPNINTILTVQNQLNSLSSLYSSRPAAARLFNTYLSEVTPENVSLSNMNVSFTDNTATLTGTADSLVTINKYVDTLKLTTYSVSGTQSSSPAFTDVVLSSFGISSQAQNANQAANFTINFNLAAPIFQATSNVTLNIPNIIVTHSEQSDSGSLFQVAPSSKGGQ